MKYTIKNKCIKIEVDSFGAELKSLINLENDTEYLWQGDPKYWNRTSPVLFPIVGKLLDDEYTYKEKLYKMSQHGFARDKEFILVEQDERVLKFMQESNLETQSYFSQISQVLSVMSATSQTQSSNSKSLKCPEKSKTKCLL